MATMSGQRIKRAHALRRQLEQGDKTRWITGHSSSRITGSGSMSCSNARSRPLHTLLFPSFEIKSGGNNSRRSPSESSISPSSVMV